MYELENPQYLYLLLSVPLLLVGFLAVALWKKRAQQAFGDIELLQKLSPNKSKNKPYIKLIIILVTSVAFSIGLVNPKIGSRLETVKREGVDIVFAIDISKSMLAEDVRPNRLEKAKQIISKSLDQLVSDRVGIIIYAGRAYPQLPITTDYAAARLFLKTTNTNLIPSQGTAIAEAIELATEYFDDENQKNRLLVILSDGEDHEEGLKEASKKALERGIKIYTIGLGTERGAPIPDVRNGYTLGYKKDRAGEVVVSRLNTQTLKEVATLTDGGYLHGKDSKETVEALLETVANMEKKEFESQVFADYEDQFQWFLGIAFVLLLLDTFVLERKTQWIKRLGLFENEKDT